MSRYLMALFAAVFALSICISAAAQEPAVKKPAVKETVTKEPPAKTPDTKASPVKVIDIKQPVAKEISVKEPVAKTPDTKASPAKIIDIKQPVAKEASAKQPAAKAPDTKVSASKTPAVKEPVRERAYRAVKALKAGGFKTCADTVDEALRFFHKKDDFAFVNLRDEKKPADTYSASIFTVKTYSDGNTYASLNVSPRPDGGCDIGFTQVFFFFETCSLIRETGFRDWKLNMEYNDVSVYEDPTSKTVVISFTPTANGCLAVKSGTLHYPPKKK